MWNYPNQVLQVINPNVSYLSKRANTRLRGVAISLKEFLKEIDNLNIENDGGKKLG